jgi:hypothetical protein
METIDNVLPPVYTVGICASPPDWTRVERAALEHSLWLGTAPETDAAMVFDPAEGFRVRMTCRESAPRAEYTAQDDPVWEDSCMEAFLNFAPEAGDAYINLEANAQGAMRCEFGDRRDGRAKLADMPLRRPSVTARQTAGFWEVEFFIPLSTVKVLFGRDRFSPVTNCAAIFISVATVPHSPITAPGRQLRMKRRFFICRNTSARW